jgi:membrane protein
VGLHYRKIFLFLYFCLFVNNTILPQNITRGVLTPKEEVLLFLLTFLGVSLFLFNRYFARILPTNDNIFKGYIDMMLKDFCTKFVILLISFVLLGIYGKENNQELCKFVIQFFLFFFSWIPLVASYRMTQDIGGFNIINVISIVVSIFIIVIFKDYFTNHLIIAQLSFPFAIGLISILISAVTICIDGLIKTRFL